MKTTTDMPDKIYKESNAMTGILEKEFQIFLLHVYPTGAGEDQIAECRIHFMAGAKVVHDAVRTAPYMRDAIKKIGAEISAWFEKEMPKIYERFERYHGSRH